MSPHYWIEFRGRKKIALFAAAVILFLGFCLILPAEVRSMAFQGPRRITSLGAWMSFGWVGGWFLRLFVRAEDLHLSAPFDFQGLSRVIAALMICMALLIAGFLSTAFFV